MIFGRENSDLYRLESAKSILRVSFTSFFDALHRLLNVCVMFYQYDMWWNLYLLDSN